MGMGREVAPDPQAEVAVAEEVEPIPQDQSGIDQEIDNANTGRGDAVEPMETGVDTQVGRYYQGNQRKLIWNFVGC